jgi:hypothetical protein
MNSGRFIQPSQSKISQSNSNRNSRINSNRSINLYKSSKFKYLDKEEEELTQSNLNPFLAHEKINKGNDPSIEIRDRRKTSGSILNKKGYKPLER